MIPTDIEIETEEIQLDQFLKWAGVLPSGGEVKALLAEGLIMRNGEKETAPMALQAGITGILPIAKLFSLEREWNLHVSADAYRRADMQDPEWRFGGELDYMQTLLLRVGYAARPDTEDGVSAGIGLNFGMITFDYGYSPKKALDGGYHYLTLGMRF